MVALTMAKLYLEILKGSKPVRPMVIIKNMRFIIRHALFAETKALKYFQIAIEMAEDLGAKGYAGQAHFELGSLHLIKKRKDQARIHFEEATSLLTEVGAHEYLSQAQEALLNLS